MSSQVKHAISPSWKKHAAAAQLYSILLSITIPRSHTITPRQALPKRGKLARAATPCYASAALRRHGT